MTTKREAEAAILAAVVFDDLTNYGVPQHQMLAAFPVVAIGDTRACPEPKCGRPQHYTGTEYGWAHDATFATLACGASPALLAELEK